MEGQPPPPPPFPQGNVNPFGMMVNVPQQQGPDHNQHDHNMMMQMQMQMQMQMAMADPLAANDMALTLEEARWAHEIKHAVVAHPDLHLHSDMDYAQWAIYTMERQDMNDVLNGMKMMQEFRKQYNLFYLGQVGLFHKDNVSDIVSSSSATILNDQQKEIYNAILQEGLQLLRDFILLQPGVALDIEWMPDHGHYLYIFDYVAMDPTKIRLPKDWRVVQGATYYSFEIFSSNLRAVRKGTAAIVECEGMSWFNFDTEYEARRHAELNAWYPFKVKEMLLLNTGTIANFACSILKKICQKEKKNFKLGCTLDGFDGRIDRLFKVPTLEKAMERLLVRLEGYLRVRLDNQMRYRLPDLPPTLDELLVAENNNNNDDDDAHHAGMDDGD